MDSKNQILKSLGGVILTTGLSAITFGSSNLILGAASGILGGIASNNLENFEFDKLKKILKQRNPEDLNHDLQKLIIVAVEWTIKNIAILYKRELTEKPEIEALKNVNEKLLQDLVNLKHILANKDDSIYRNIEKPNSDDELIQLFDINLSQLPIINEEKPYKQFFKKHFNDNLQLCFGELLKNPKYNSALIAYQRSVYQNIDSGLQQIISDNKKILEKLENTSTTNNYNTIKENETLKKLSNQLQNTDFNKLSPLFETAFENHFNELNSKVNLVINQNEAIKTDLEFLKSITKGFNKELQDNWLSKNKVIVYSITTVLIIAIAGLIYSKLNQPFNANINLSKAKGLKTHKEYPKIAEQALLRIYLPNEVKEKQIGNKNEVLFNEIQSKYLKQKFKVELIDKFWTTVNDSIILKSGNNNLTIKPNEQLATIEGVVKSRDGEILIENAKITSNDITAFTNKNGIFNYKLPIHLRKREQTLRIEHPNYSIYEIEYIVGSKIEIRLENK